MARSGLRIIPDNAKKPPGIQTDGYTCWAWPLLSTRKNTRPPNFNSAGRDTQKPARSLRSRIGIYLPQCETLGQNKRPGSSDATPAGQCSPCARSTSELGKSIHPDLLLPHCGKKATAVSISVHKDKAMPIRVDKFVPIACLRLAPRVTLGIRTLGYGEGLAACVLNSSNLDKAEVTSPRVVSVTSQG